MNFTIYDSFYSSFFPRNSLLRKNFLPFKKIIFLLFCLWGEGEIDDCFSLEIFISNTPTTALLREKDIDMVKNLCPLHSLHPIHKAPIL